MRDERFTVGSNIPVNGLEDRIVGHDVFSVRVLQFHAYIFPDLNGYGAARKIVIELLDRLAREAGLLEWKGIERSAQGCMPLAALNEFPGTIDLRLQRTENVVVVCHNDVEDVQVQAPHHGQEGGVVVEGVGVRIHRLESSKPFEVTHTS